MATLTTEQATKKIPAMGEALFGYADEMLAKYKAWNAIQLEYPSDWSSDEWRREYFAEQEAKFAQGIAWNVGRNYIKVVQHEGQHLETRVHSFIVISEDNQFGFKFGDILKAASWKKPATNFSRGNIFGDYKIDWAGAL